MASKYPVRSLSLALSPLCPRCRVRMATPGLRRALSACADSASPSPLLSKVKNDLKAAMRAKDTARLAVLRGTISEINQAASGPSPISTDMQVLALLRKRKAASRAAATEAELASRPDLAEKQEKEIAVIDELMGTVPLMDPLEMRHTVRSTIAALRGDLPGELKQGTVIKELLKPGGALAGKPLENKVLAELVREELLSNHGPS